MVDVMDVDDALLVVSELADRGTLLDYISSEGKKRGSPGLPEREARRLFRQICEAVHYLHAAHRLVHQDIKCENVLLASPLNPETGLPDPSQPPVAKLADFGLTERIEDLSPAPASTASSPGASEQRRDSKTSPGGFCVGSLQYCSPEEVRGLSGSSADPSYARELGDAWSLGC
ncbi:Testis-specific serine/threonine-protein kinase 4, partial [Irineochytrium annulatum]